MSEDLPDRMPNRMSEDMPDRMSEDMPDGMPNKYAGLVRRSTGKYFVQAL